MKITGPNALFPIPILVLTAFLFWAGASLAADPARLPDGFRGVPWGARIETLPDMEKVDAEGDVVHYDRVGEKMTLGPIAVRLIDYSFYKGKFYHAAILYERGFDVVRETLEAKYGKPDGTRRKTAEDGRDYTVTEWFWPGKAYIGHRRFVDEDGGRIFYFYAPLADLAMGRVPAKPKPGTGGGEYLVKKGDTLSLIAQRLGVGLDALRAANGGLDPKKLQPGQKLVVPGGAKTAGAAAAPAETAAAAAPATPDTPVAPDTPVTPDMPVTPVMKVAPATPDASGAADAAGGTYVVKSGDSPSSIAARHGLSTTALMRANKGLDPKKLQPGQTLVIPLAKAAKAAKEGGEAGDKQAATARDAAKAAPEEAQAAVKHVVKAGDLIKDLARRYGTTEAAILEANGVKDPRKLQIGQILKIPPSPSP